jgi:hypothetical protein
MIATEERGDHPKVVVVTHDGTRTRPYVKERGNGFEKWIRKAIEPMLTFNPQK